MIDLKAVAAGTLLSAGLAFGAVGIGAGVANAAPVAPVPEGPLVIAEHPPGHGHGHGPGHDRWWRGPGPRHWDPVDACIGIQGPLGYAQASACI
ncbi:hypothetical protein CQY20_11330 [Mycolicibacterium agri]|uniref:Uncharacterized protein n=1 Tax=Mycolicibacterium agri TaxID=36811 RepID=A0A2A7N5H3_MYCAG|nr:hypothetical protein [Mycolicibacterium agri]PEG39134.1 hypothetical protein CQY20_11330 [Mycolicibacterium agri]GFG53936.1 hypothetical protein MAGR_53770 [Mycolicibacterium agri]